MQILENESLSKYTTIRIGGTAKKLLIPESVSELKKLIEEESPEYFISGGSNLLIAEREFDKVVLLRKFNTKLEHIGNGKFVVGASVRLQTLIKTINDLGYGGIEYLYSVPGMIGGAVVMNAGRGKKYNKCLSDYINKVYVLKNHTLMCLEKSECRFEYRNSIFKNSKDYIIVEVEFEFPEQSLAESLRLKNDRMNMCKRVQDNSKPNFGSVFMQFDPKIMKLVRKLHISKGNVSFSGKTNNWILSDNGSFNDTICVIKRIQEIHKLFRKKAVPEVIIWR